jgi:GT2 family glycosyltransferase
MNGIRHAANAPLAATVAIPSYQRPQLLLDTVRSVLRARSRPREIVVIDQSPLPHSELSDLGTVRGCEVRYIHSPTPGVSRARNLAFRLASQDIVVLLDDDMLVGDDSLEHLLAGQRGHGARAVATGRVLAAAAEGPGLPPAPGALVSSIEPAIFRGRQPVQVVPGANVALPRSVLLEIGGYDERLGPGTRFPAAEDHDLSLRLLDAGCEVRHVPEAVVLHRSWRSRRALVRLRWTYARGVGAFYAKHASLHDRHVLERAAREVRICVRTGTASLLRSPSATAGEVVSLAGLLVGAVEWSLRYRTPRGHASGEQSVSSKSSSSTHRHRATRRL